MKLRISDNLVLGADFVTSTQAILAQKGKGKTHTATVQAEELLDAHQQIVVIDPTDAWYGLRSSPDGRSTGYPIAVFGGDHGDVVLEPSGGAVLAEAIVRERFSAIVCTDLMTKGEQLRFLGDFLETLYRKNREAIHLFIDEADIVAPQQPYGGEMKTCGAADDIVRRGRKKGIGCTLITQRASVLNKNVLSQADMLVALGCSHPLDLAAIDKWVRRNADAALAKEMMESLPSLPRGAAWVWNPSQHLFKRVAIRQRRTFDSGATPKAGEKKHEPKILAPVDIARLGQSMAEAVQRQKENDPKLLKAELSRWKKSHDALQANMEREIQRQLAKSPAKTLKVVMKPVLRDDQIARIEKLIEGRVAAAISRANSLVDRAGELTKQAAEMILESGVKLETELSSLRAAIKLAVEPPAVARHVRANVRMPERKTKPTMATNGTNDMNGTKTDSALKPAHLRLLSAIAWWESIGILEPDLGGVAFIAGTTTKSSAFNNNRSRLRTAGYIEYPSSGRVLLTSAGRAIAPPPILPPTHEALHEAILEKVTPAHGRMLRSLIEVYPSELSLEDFATQAGTSTTSSAFNNNRSWLRARGLAEYPRTGYVRATALLFPEAS